MDLTPAERLVDEVLAAQRAKGRAKYGQGLDHADGHDWPMEALQELADATQYLAAEVVRLRGADKDEAAAGVPYVPYGRLEACRELKERDAALARVRSWPIRAETMAADVRALFAFIRPLWAFAEAGYWQQDDESAPTRWELRTVGWSGNEAIADALRENEPLWNLCWVSSARGGHHVFELPRQARDAARMAKEAACG